jgi:predicted secreted protein
LAGKSSKYARVYVENSSGTALQFEQCSGVDLDRTRSNIDTSVIGTEWKEYVPDQIEWSMSIEGNYYPSDPGQAELRDGFYADGEAVTVRFRPEGNGNGKPEEYGDAIISGFKTGAKTGDKISVSFSLTGTGPLSQGVQS